MPLTRPQRNRTDGAAVLLTKTNDRFTPAVATRLPLTSLGSPDDHLSPRDRATAFAYVALAQSDLSVLVDHTMFSLERNWWLVTKKHFAANDVGLGRLWRPDQARTQARRRLEDAVVVDNALRRLARAADGTPVWGLAGGPVEKSDADTLRQKADGPLADIEGEQLERRRGMKRTFELIKVRRRHPAQASLTL